MEPSKEGPLEAKELNPSPQQQGITNEGFSNINLTPSQTSKLNQQLPKYTNLLTSPVRRLLYPKIYPGFQPLFQSELQKEAAIVNELERLTRQIVFLQQDNQRLHTDNTTLVDSLDEKENLIDELSHQQTESENLILELQGQIAKKEVQIMDAERNIKTFDQQVQQLQSSEENLTKWNEKIQEEQTKLREQLQGSNEEVTRLANVVAETQQWNAKLTDDVQELTKLCQERDKKILQANEVVDQYKGFNEKLTQDVKTFTTHLDERDKEIQRLTRLNQEHIAKIDLLNATVTDRENIISGYEAECKIHISNIEDLNKTLAQKGNEIRDNREMIDSQKTKIGELEVELQNLKADKAGLQTTLVQKTAQIDGLGASLTQEQLERQRIAAIASQKDMDINSLRTRVDILSNPLNLPMPRFQSQYISPLSKSYIPRYDFL